MPLMQYIMTVREEMACLLVLLYVALTYYATRRKKTRAHNLFSLLLFSAVLNVTMDAVTIYTVNHRDTIPELVNHGMHIVFLASFPVILWLLYLYIKSLAFSDDEYRLSLFEILPIIAAVIAIVELPIDYVTSPHSDYSTGAAPAVAYIFAFVYFVLCFVLLICYRKKMEPKARRGISLALLSLISVVVAQAIVHQLLMTGVGVTLIVVALYYSVESPDAALIEKLEHEMERADSANEAKSSFLAHMSHEIRTPINAVLGMDEMILRESGEPQIREYAENIRTSGRTLLSIINDILDFSKVEAGKMEIIPAQYEIASAINDVYNMTRERAEKKGLAFYFDVDTKLPSVLYGDEIRIKQCMLNIVTNAIKYTEKGSVNVRIDFKEKGNNLIIVRFVVRDTGIGMKPEDIDKIFMPFVRIDERKNRSVEGTGLGMNITRQLLALMGTDLEVTSTYGEGSEFSFAVEQGVVSDKPIGRLEDVRREENEQHKERNIGKFRAPNARVLVIDDTEMNHKVIAGLLKRTRIRVDKAMSGQEALEMAERNRYDVYLIDHIMPGMDGIETLDRLKDIPGLEDAVFIALTANAISGAREMYLDAGFRDYLAKPVEGDKLEDMILKYLPDSLVEAVEDAEPEIPAHKDVQAKPVKETSGQTRESAHPDARIPEKTPVKREAVSEDVLAETYKSLLEFARDKDEMTIRGVLGFLSEFELSAGDMSRIREIRSMVDASDWDGLIGELEGRN